MAKVKPMPKLEPEGEVERHMAYTRLNPSGDKELVVGDDEETLNELSEDILEMLESISFSGPLPIGGGMGSSEQLETDRRHNQPDPPLMVSLDGDQERANQDTLTNMTGSTPLASDGPERSRAKSKYRASPRGNGSPIKNIAGYRDDGPDLGVTRESFTGTGAIAIAPGGGYSVVDDEDEDEDEEIIEGMMDNDMEYKGYHISKSRHGGYEWYATDYDGAPNHPDEQPADDRAGHSPDLESAVMAIDDLVADEEYERGDQIKNDAQKSEGLDDEYEDLDEPTEGDIDYGYQSHYGFGSGPERPRRSMESIMSQNDVLTEEVNQVINEWEPSFASGEYSPGEYQMPKPKGDGVAERKPTKDKVGAYDTDTTQDGKEWPRDHKDTEAMSSVGDDGTDDGSGGYHNSSHAEASDGHQDAVGHNWPDEAKNTGSGVAEPFEGERWSDGGTLKGSGADEEHFKPGGPGMPNDGPITGTSGPQYGEPAESWSPQGIGTLMEGDIDLQDLFNNYARDFGRTVCLDDFQALCHAHGCDAVLDERSLVTLMAENKEFVFYQGEDANGYYWQPNAIVESKTCKKCNCDPCTCEGDDDDGGNPFAESKTCSKCGCDPCDCDDDDCVEEGENRRPFGQVISELQIRSPRQEAKFYGGIGDDTLSHEYNRSGSAPGGPEGERRPMGDPHMTDAEYAPQVDDLDNLELGNSQSSDYDDMLGGAGQLDAMHGPGEFGGHGAATDSCPECGEVTSSGEEMCPGCGAPLDDMGMGDMEGGMGGIDDLEGGMGGMGIGGMDEIDDMGLDDDMSMGGGMGDLDMDSGMGPDGPMGPNDPMGPDLPDEVVGPFDQGPEDFSGGRRGLDLESTLVNSPKIMEGLNGFMSSARRILEQNHDFHREHIAEALNLCWTYHARHVNARKAPASVKATLEGLMKTFPGFRPLTEGGSDAMNSGDGTAIGTGGADNSSDFLAEKDQPGMDEMKDEGEPLGKSQKNSLKGTPVISGTAKGMDGKGSVAQSVKENVARLSKHVQKELQEGAVKNLRGKYGLKFALMVTEGKKTNRTTIRKRLSEALADAEELLQLHDAEDVALEATFTDRKGTVALKQAIPLFTIKPRGVIVSEGKAIFRFKRTAENFANALVAEGATCRVLTHNWGRAVVTKVPLTLAETAFRSLKK